MESVYMSVHVPGIFQDLWQCSGNKNLKGEKQEKKKKIQAFCGDLKAFFFLLNIEGWNLTTLCGLLNWQPHCCNEHGSSSAVHFICSLDYISIEWTRLQYSGIPFEWPNWVKTMFW